jgi:hypothetical protein
MSLSLDRTCSITVGDVAFCVGADSCNIPLLDTTSFVGVDARDIIWSPSVLAFDLCRTLSCVRARPALQPGQIPLGCDLTFLSLDTAAFVHLRTENIKSAHPRGQGCPLLTQPRGRSLSKDSICSKSSKMPERRLLSAERSSLTMSNSSEE